MLKELEVSTKSRVARIGGLGKYSLHDTLECGQCFRFEKAKSPDDDEEIYVVTTKHGVVRVGQRVPGELIFYGIDGEIPDEIKSFFALDRPLSLIKKSVLAACRRYLAQNHIRGFLDGEFAGDVFSSECLAFPDSSRIPPPYRRSPNPGIVFIAV